MDGITVLTLNKPQLIVLSYHAKLSSESREVLRREWKSALSGTDLESIQMVVIDGGLQVAIIEGAE